MTVDPRWSRQNRPRYSPNGLALGP